MLFRLSHKSRSVANGVRIRLSQSIPSPSITSDLLPYTLHARFGFFFLKERKRRVRNYRTEKVTKRPARIRTGDLSLTGRMLFRLSHKSRSVVNGVWIRLSQLIPSPSLTSHLLPYTLHARFVFFFFERKKEKSEKLPNGNSDQETCRESNWGSFAYRANALPTEPQVLKSRSVVNGVRIQLSQSIPSPSLTSHLLLFFFLKERKRRVRNYRTEKVTKRPARIRSGDHSLTGQMLFRLSHKSRSVVNGVRIRPSQSIPSPALTSHPLPYTLHARFGYLTWTKVVDGPVVYPANAFDSRLRGD